MQVHGLQQGVGGHGQCPPSLLSALIVGDQAGGQELAQGDLDRGWPNGPAMLGERGGELAGGLWAASSERLEHASGSRPQLAVGSASLATAA